MPSARPCSKSWTSDPWCHLGGELPDPQRTGQSPKALYLPTHRTVSMHAGYPAPDPGETSKTVAVPRKRYRGFELSDTSPLRQHSPIRRAAQIECRPRSLLQFMSPSRFQRICATSSRGFAVGIPTGQSAAGSNDAGQQAAVLRLCDIAAVCGITHRKDPIQPAGTGWSVPARRLSAARTTIVIT